MPQMVNAPVAQRRGGNPLTDIAVPMALMAAGVPPQLAMLSTQIIGGEPNSAVNFLPMVVDQLRQGTQMPQPQMNAPAAPAAQMNLQKVEAPPPIAPPIAQGPQHQNPLAFLGGLFGGK